MGDESDKLSLSGSHIVRQLSHHAPGHIRLDKAGAWMSLTSLITCKACPDQHAGFLGCRAALLCAACPTKQGLERGAHP